MDKKPASATLRFSTPRFCPHCHTEYPEIVSLDVVNAYQPVMVQDDGSVEWGVSTADWESALGQEYQYDCCGEALEEEEQVLLDRMLGTERHPVSLQKRATTFALDTEDTDGR